MDWALGRAVKPNRLLFPALAPAVKAGLRLPRMGRASELSLPLLLAAFERPLRSLQAGAGAFPARAVLPEERVPLPEPLPECVPAERVADGRASELMRRAGRPPVDDCAGFRSLEWVVRRQGLKWGRAAALFPPDEGLRAAELRGARASPELAALSESMIAGSACELGFGASTSVASSSRSQE